MRGRSTVKQIYPLLQLMKKDRIYSAQPEKMRNRFLTAAKNMVKK